MGINKTVVKLLPTYEYEVQLLPKLIFTDLGSLI